MNEWVSFLHSYRQSPTINHYSVSLFSTLYAKETLTCAIRYAQVRHEKLTIGQEQIRASIIRISPEMCCYGTRAGATASDWGKQRCIGA